MGEAAGGTSAWRRDGQGREFKEYRPSGRAPTALQQGGASRGGWELPRSGDLLLIVPAAGIAALGVLTTLLVAQASSPVGSGGVEVVAQLPSTYLI
jgi:hypothetical protein